MLRQLISTVATLAASLVFGLGFMSAAHAQSFDEILANPKVGDILAAQLDHFSEADFGDDDIDWGLMRVIKVTSSTIIVVTADAAYYTKSDALSELKTLDDTDWDESEKITIKRSDLQSLKKDGYIFGARRL